jgi:hypothetical protein
MTAHDSRTNHGFLCVLTETDRHPTMHLGWGDVWGLALITGLGLSFACAVCVPVGFTSALSYEERKRDQAGTSSASQHEVIADSVCVIRTQQHGADSVPARISVLFIPLRLFVRWRTILRSRYQWNWYTGWFRRSYRHLLSSFLKTFEQKVSYKPGSYT